MQMMNEDLDSRQSHVSLSDLKRKFRSADRTVMNNLLSNAKITFDDKLTAVKATRIVDKNRFECALKELMKK
jgi:hypothetical protein